MITQVKEALNSLMELPNYKDLLKERGQLIMKKCQNYLNLMIDQEKKFE